jgi:NADPH:quinone reductase-like Zn-dependent oxidoreductase
MTMRVMAIEQFGGAETLVATNQPRPRPAADEVLIRVVSAGVNPVDFKICEGQLSETLPHSFPLVPGWDVAGVIEEFGELTNRFRKGDRVWAYARKPTVQWGCYAEYVTVPDDNVALMPSRLLHEEAAAIPLAAHTGYQCLFGKPGIGAGSTVLIHGAAGGVGHLATQLAKDVGAIVLGTDKTENLSFILDRGCSTGIDYTADDFTAVVRRHYPEGVDLVLDAIGGDVLTRSYTVVKPGGRLVSICEEPDQEEAQARKIAAHFLFVRPDAAELTQIAGLVDRNRLQPHVQKIYPLNAAPDALATLKEGRVRGKLVLNL